MTKSLHYWEQIFDNTPSEPCWKVLELLRKYSGGINLFGTGLLLQNASLFFHGNWNRTFAHEVLSVISQYYHFQFGLHNDENHYFKIPNIVGMIKFKIEASKKNIKIDGDFNLILKVISERTGVDYFSIPSIDPDDMDKMMVQKEQANLNDLIGIRNHLNN